MGIKTGKPVLGSSLLLNGFVPLTAGTCLLVSMNPCYAHGGGGGNPERGIRHHQGGRNAGFAGGASFNQLQNGFTQAFNERVQRKTTGVDSRRFDLDLSSTLKNIELGTRLFNGAANVSINAGGVQQTFAAGDQVTAAQYVAIQQVLSKSPQSIAVSAQGTASGGSFALDQAAASHVNNLVIPQSVAASNNFANNRSVNLSGDLTNLGSIYGLSTNNRVRSGVISADDINNSGNISTDLSGTSLQGAGNVRHVDLTLVAEHDLNNSGSITSSGALTVASAYGSVSNSGNISAQRGDLSVFAGDGNLNNSGSLNALSGNLNIDASQIASDLNINGAGGSFNALRGDINIRDISYTDTNNTTMNGGTYNSGNLNIFAGGGTVNASVDEISGKVNTSGLAAHIQTEGGTLTLGTNCLTGDPTFANTTGDILITGAVTAGESIAILAAGNIIASGNAFISTANSTGATAVPNTNVTLVAGGLVTTTGTQSSTIPGVIGIGTGQTATVNFTGGTGGNIDFSKSKFLGALINTSSNLQGGGGNNQQANGGDVLLAAFANGTVGGNVLFPASRSSITTTSAFGTSGDLTIIAGALGGAKSKPAITTGIINTQADPITSNINQSGTVTLFAAQPETSTGAPITFNSSGAITGAVVFETNPANLSFTSGNIQLTGSILAGVSDVNMQTSGTGGLSQISSKVPLRVQGGIVTLIGGLGGVGTAKARIATQSSAQLNLASTSNVFVNNLGSVTLNGGAFTKATAGDLGIFDVTTTPDGQGNGKITIANNTTIQAQSGTLGTLNLTSSERLGGTGGIRDGGGTTNLIATNINLKDGADGLGTGDIGTGGNTITTTAAFLSVNTAGNAFVTNSGSVTLLDSSAGNSATFQLNTVPVGNNGSITLGGDIASVFGLIGNITLDSSENAGGTGGIIPGGTLIADSIDLSDSTGGTFNSNGTAAIGTALAPIVVETSNLTVNSLGPIVNIKNVIATGMTLGDSQSALANGNAFQVLSSGGILVNGTIDTGSLLTLISTGKGAAGYIIVGNPLNTNVAGGTVSLTAGGDITRRGGLGTLITADNVIFTSTAGGAGTDILPILTNSFSGAINITSNCTGYTNISNTDNSATTLLGTTSKNQFSLSSNGSIIVAAAILTPTGIKLATTSTTAPITLNANVGSTKTTNVVEINTNGTGDITAPIGVIVGAKQLVNFSTDGGDVGILGAPITVSTPGLSANTNKTSGTVNITALATKSVPLTLFNSGSFGDFALNANGSLLLNNIQTVDGSISVITTAGTLATNINSIIQVAEPGNKTTAAENILLQNAAAKASKGAAISIGAGTKIATYVTTPGTGVAGPGSIRIIADTNATPTQVVGALPANVVLGVQTGGTTFFGTNGITALAPNNTMDNVGADITFSTGTKPASAILLGGGVLIHADPPVTGSSTPLVGVPMPAPLVGASAPPAVPATIDSGLVHGVHVTNPVLPITSLTSNQLVNAGGIPVPSIDSTNSSMTNFATLSQELSNAQMSINFCSAQKDGWISETELSNGEIPAQIFGDVTVSGDATAGSVLEYPSTVSNPVTNHITSGQPLVGAISTSVGPKVATLNRGTVVVASSTDTVINTPVGQIKVGAKSLALVMAFANGLAVYDLDDVRKGAVEVVAGGQSITMSPGQHIFVANNNARGFEDVNPAQMIGYRGITSRDLNNGLKVFSAEFSVPHACHAVKPLKHLLQSNHPHDKKVAAHLLKTTAVTMQLRGRNGEYQQVFRPRKTAWAQ